MATVLLVCVVILVIAALVFGIVSLLTGEDPGLAPVEPDGRALPLPNHRSLTESDLKSVRFDVTLRGYRMAQVDRALRRTAYDVGYKDEMIAVLEAEVAALREGRVEDADLLRKAREAAASPEPTEPTGMTAASSDADEADDSDEADEADEADGAESASEPSEGSEASGASEASDASDAPDASEEDEGQHATATRVDGDAAVTAGGRDDEAPVIGSAPTVGELPKVGRSASTREPAADDAVDQAVSAGQSGPVDEAGSGDDAEEADDGNAAERPATATAPAARSAPKKSTKRAARA
jgi:DivIVA domain-containing protein